MTPRTFLYSCLACATCFVIGAVCGMDLEAALTRNDYRTCWASLDDVPVQIRVNACSPYLAPEWKKTQKGWKQ